MSIATVLQQSPFMLFYELVQGKYMNACTEVKRRLRQSETLIAVFIPYNTDEHPTVLSLNTSRRLLGTGWLNAEVHI